MARYRLLLLLFLVITQFLLASGQDANTSLQPTGKVVEVYSGNLKSPSIIPLQYGKPNGFWSSNFPSIKDWKLPSGEQRIQVINIEAKLIDEKSEVTVTVFKGKRFGEINELVVKVMLSEGESVEVPELKKYGYHPITLKMVLIGTTTSNVPLVSNPAKSLKIFVNPTVSTAPSFNVKVVNESSNSVLAIAWHTEAGGRRLLSSMPRGRHGESLINANGEYVVNIKNNNTNPSIEYTSLVIDAVIYEDGTVDGDYNKAATFFAFIEGEKKALSKIIPLLQSAIQTHSQKLDISSLITRIDAITEGTEDKDGQPTSAVGVSFASIIKDLVVAVRKLDSNSADKSDAGIRNDLMELLRFYEEWQNKLSIRWK